MDQQQLLATLIQLSDEQQQRIAELLNRLEGQAQTLTRASQQAAWAASAAPPAMAPHCHRKLFTARCRRSSVSSAAFVTLAKV